MDDMQNRKDDRGCYEVYYIKEDELKLLLAGLGQKRWYGLFAGESDSSIRKKDSSVNAMLADMYQNDMVDWEGAGVTVRQPYADMLSMMLEKKVCVTMQISGTASPVRCCYLSKKGIVMTQKSQREEHTLGMAQITMQTFASLLEEECIRLEEEENCCLNWRSSIDGHVDRGMQIRKDGIRVFRMEWDDGSVICCTREELGSKLMELLKME